MNLAFRGCKLCLSFTGHLQWIISEFACYTYSMVAVPLYDTLGPEALVFIINQGNWSFSCTIMLLIMEASLSPVTRRPHRDLCL